MSIKHFIENTCGILY